MTNNSEKSATNNSEIYTRTKYATQLRSGHPRPIEELLEPSPLRNRTPFSISHPEVAVEWHPTKNNGFFPDDFSYGANVMAWWRCSTDRAHEWKAAIRKRTKLASRCPYCSHKIITPMIPQVIALIESGKSYKEVADQLDTTETTVTRIMINTRGRLQSRTYDAATERTLTLELIDQGLTYRQIGARLGIAPRKVGFWVNCSGPTLKKLLSRDGKRKPATESQEKKLVKRLAAKGATYKQIAEQLGITRYKVALWAKLG